MNIHNSRYRNDVSKFLIDYDFNTITKLVESDPDGRLYLITATFGQGRFSGSTWQFSTGERRYQLIDQSNKILLYLFRGWYIRLLNRCVPNFRAHWMRKYQPRIVAYVDDQRDHSPRPHIHAIAFIPSRYVRTFETWVAGPFIQRLASESGFKGGNAASEWRNLEANGELHVRRISGADDLRYTMGYAAKTYAQLSRLDAYESFRFEFPHID